MTKTRSLDRYKKNTLLRICMLTLGCICVLLGVIGLFVPMMPGAVFLILAAWLFARSSDRFHTALLNHKYLGPQIQAWQSGRGFERKLRRRILCILWLGLCVTLVLTAKLWLAALMVSSGIIATAFILTRPVYDEDKR